MCAEIVDDMMAASFAIRQSTHLFSISLPACVASTQRNPSLLNEFLKAHSKMEQQEATIAEFSVVAMCVSNPDCPPVGINRCNAGLLILLTRFA